MGSDGLFDYLSNDEMCQIARSAASPEAAAGALADAVKLKALHENGISQKDYDALPESKRRDIHDDVTVTVFYIQFPEPWLTRFRSLSESLQTLCDGVTKQSRRLNREAEKFDFSVCIADPSLADCPLVAVSKGFERLTGYRVDDAIGRNCRFLSFGVPDVRRDGETTSRLRKFTQVATSGDPFAEFEEFSSGSSSAEGAFPSWLPEELRGVGGASFFVRWNRRRDGTLFRNLFVLRQVWVGDRTYIVALQTALADEGELSKETLREVSRLAEAVSSEVEKLLPSLTKTKEGSMAENRELSEAMRRFRKGDEFK